MVFFNGLLAQQQQQVILVKKSTDKVKIEGKTYYIHIVQKGESLYSISKAYGVSQIEIATENPDIYLGLQVEQALKIPAKDLPSQVVDTLHIHHLVKKGETLFGLSKRYQVSIDDIVKANPDVESGLVLSQVLLIPRDKLSTADQQTKRDSGEYIYHQVRPKEGLYSISKHYNVSIQDIENLNKDLLVNGLKLGTTLKIPRQSTVIISTQQTFNDKTQPSIVKEEDKTIKAVRCDTFNYSKSKRVFNVALLLPILPENQVVDSDDQIDPVTGEKIVEKAVDKDKISAKSSNYLDFYEGFLFAVDSLKKEGLSLNLSVLNTKNSVSDINSLMNDKAIKQADLIIGPVYPELMKPMANFCRENRINIVSPLSPNNSLLKDNPYYFQANPSYSAQVDEFASKVDFSPKQNLMIVFEDDSSSLDMVNTYKAGVAKRISQYSNSDAIHFKEIVYVPGGDSKVIKEKLNQSLSDEKENVILVPSDNEAFVSDFLSHLFALTTYYNYKVKVYGFPKWQRFKNIPIQDYYYKLNLHLFTPFYVDYTRNNVKRFVDKYRRYYRSEPSQYSFQGYDIGLYFLKAIKTYGVDFKFCLKNLDVDLLQSKYRFEQDRSRDGFENKSVYLIHYTPDYDIKESE